MTVQLGIRLNGWHAKELEKLAAESMICHGTVAKDLLMAAIEQASDDPPPRIGGTHLKRFFEGRKT